LDQLAGNAALGATRQEIFNELVTEIYDSTTRPEGFEPFLAKLCQYTNSQYSIMSATNADVGIHMGGWVHGFKPEILRIYNETGINKKDPIMQAVLNSTPGRFFTLRELVSLEDLQQDEGFKNWAEPLGIIDAAGGLISAEGSVLTTLFVQRIDSQGLFVQEHLELFNSLIPHLQRAIGLYLRLLDSRTSNLPLTAALDTFKTPTIVFDPLGMVMFANKNAQNFIENRNWLTIEKSGALTSRNSNLSTKLTNSLLKNFTYAIDDIDDELSVIHVEIEGENIAFCMQPLNSGKKSGRHGGALLFIHQQDNSIDETKTRLIAELFHLTPAEAGVSLLLSQGMALKEIAKFTDRKGETVRTQLKSAFAKTGVNSQSQLVSLILTSPVFLT